MKQPALLLPALLLPALLTIGCDRIVDSIKGGGSGGESGTLKAGVVDLSDDGIDAFVARRGQIVVLDFHADWCPPCRTLAPKLERISAEFGDRMVLGKVDVDRAPAAAARFGVSGIPDVRIFIDGRQVDRFVGDLPEAGLRHKFDALGARLSTSPEPPPEAAASGPGEEGGPAIQPMSKDWLPPGVERK